MFFINEMQKIICIENKKEDTYKYELYTFLIHEYFIKLNPCSLVGEISDNNIFEIN